jgi:hypothetical protein
MGDNQALLPWIPGMFCVRCAMTLLSCPRLLEPDDPGSVCNSASDTVAHFKGHESPCVLLLACCLVNKVFCMLMNFVLISSY